ncbi:MAG: GNAT family N-acetyltransferase, partial [Saprospiraceae bacterium]|nr:GNAT family N-acetyltransferase [Saprospiraceae bacterium]
GCYSSDTHELVGVLTLKPVDHDIIKMRQVAVSESFQSKGIGTYLVKSSETFAKSKDFKRIELHARLESLAFYIKNEYIAEGEQFKEVGIDHQAMYKNL